MITKILVFSLTYATASMTCDEIKGAYKSSSCCAEKEWQEPDRNLEACSCGLAQYYNASYIGDSYFLYHYTGGSESKIQAKIAHENKPDFRVRASKLFSGGCSYVTDDHTQTLAVVKVPYGTLTDPEFVNNLLALDGGPNADPNPDPMVLTNLWSLYSPMAMDSLLNTNYFETVESVLSSLGVNSQRYTMKQAGLLQTSKPGSRAYIVLTNTSVGYDFFPDKLIDLWAAQSLLSGNNEETDTGMVIGFSSPEFPYASEKTEQYWNNDKLIEVFSEYPEVIQKGYQVIGLNSNNPTSPLISPPPLDFKMIESLSCLF